MLLRSRPCKRGSCTGPLPSLLFSPRIHNYRNRIPGECPEKSFSYCVNSWRMPSEGPFAAFCAPPRIIEKIPFRGLSCLSKPRLGDRRQKTIVCPTSDLTLMPHHL